MYSKKGLLEKARGETRNDEQLVIMTVFASILAVFGIFLNNQFILLGAMLISPFFDPLISLIVFMYTRKDRDGYRAVGLFIAMSIISIVVSVGLFYLLSFRGQLDSLVFDISLVPEYFFIAIILGMIGTMLWLWKTTSNTSAGISIAISLIPPLANIGRGIVIADTVIVFGSLSSFVFNSFGILVGATFVILLRNRIKKFRLF